MYPDGSLFHLKFHMDDALYYRNNNKIEKVFNKEFQEHFGQAHLFLQMQIHCHSDGSVALVNQYQFVLNLVLQCFATNDTQYGMPKYHNNPAQPEYNVLSMSNQPITNKDHHRASGYPAEVPRLKSCLVLA